MRVFHTLTTSTTIERDDAELIVGNIKDSMAISLILGERPADTAVISDRLIEVLNRIRSAALREAVARGDTADIGTGTFIRRDIAAIEDRVGVTRLATFVAPELHELAPDRLVRHAISEIAGISLDPPVEFSAPANLPLYELQVRAVEALARRIDEPADPRDGDHFAGRPR